MECIQVAQNLLVCAELITTDHYVHVTFFQVEAGVNGAIVSNIRVVE